MSEGERISLRKPGEDPPHRKVTLRLPDPASPPAKGDPEPAPKPVASEERPPQGILLSCGDGSDAEVEPDPAETVTIPPTANRAMALGLTALALTGFVLGTAAHRASSATEEWPTVTGVITSSRVVTERDSEGTERSYLYAKYDYQAAGRSFEGSNLRFHATTSFRSREHAENYREEKYLPGARVAVYVDPDDPSRAVLVPGATLEGFAIIAISFFPALMAGVQWFKVLRPSRS